MKKIFLLAIIAISMITPTVKISAVWCDECFDPIIIDSETESNTGESSGYDQREARASSAYTEAYQIKKSEDELANIRKHKFMNEVEEMVTAWRSRGFQGDPTFPTNPGRYFENIEKSSIRLNIDEINDDNEEDILSDDVTEEIIENYRENSSTVDQKVIFTLGKTIQDNNCSDEALSARARKIVGNNADVNLYNSKKKELSDQLCSKDAKTDKEAQKKNLECFAGDFMCGGWGAWIDLVSNPKNTEYGNVLAAKQAIYEKSSNKVTLAKEELDQNNGFIGIKKCVKEVYLEKEGITSCDEYETVTDGSFISEDVVDAIFGPTETLSRAKGSRDVFDDVIESIDSDFENFMANGFSLNQRAGTSVNSNTEYTLTSGSYVKTPLDVPNIKTPLTNEQRTIAINDIMNQLNNDLNLVTFSKNINRNIYFTFLNTYETELNKLESKYNTLTTEFPLYKAKAMITYGNMYISNQRKEASEFRNQLNNDISNLSVAETIINETKIKLNKAADYFEIQSIYRDYSNTVTGKLIPNNISSAEFVEKKYQSKKSELERDMSQTLSSNLNQCQATIDLERTKRACLEQSKYNQWVGYCYRDSRRECADKGGYWAWNGTSCVDTTPSSYPGIW